MQFYTCFIIVPDDPYAIHIPPNPIRPAMQRATRQAQDVISRILEEGKELAAEIRMKEKEVQRMELQEEETCCICFENLDNEQNTTYCKYGCGRNFHMK